MVSILGANSASSDSYEISNSLRLDDGSNSFLSKSFGSDGNRRTFTFSCWTKGQADSSAYHSLFTSGNDNPDTSIWFNPDEALRTNTYNSGSIHDVITNRVFRDPSAWYHIVVAYDTTQSTASNRVKIYVNGVQETSFSTSSYPDQNYETFINDASYTHRVGSHTSSAYAGDGYLCEVAFIDGTQYAASNFGEFDDNGVWIPKDFKNDVTFGSNGFYLEFKQTGTSANSSGIGADTSGNDNHLAVSNLVASSVVPDTPTLNYATMNPLDAPSNFSSAHGNLRVNGSSSGSGSIGSTMYVNTGKWYVEMRAEDMGNGMSVGIKSDTEGTSWKPTLGESVIYQSDSNKIIDGGSATSYGATYGVGDIIGIKINLDDGEIEFLKNNSSQGNASTSLSSGVYFGIFFLDTSSIDNARAMFNFGQDSTFVGATSAGNNSDANGYGDFKYAVPSGYYALNTKNLAEFG
jgi:hypothetical protein